MLRAIPAVRRLFCVESARSGTSWWRPELRIAAAVVLASAVGLFLELAMVRWHASCFHTFGVFKNISMLSCFLGLGIGFAKSGQGKRPRLGVVLPLLAVQCLAFAIISRTRLGRVSLNPVAEHYIMWQSQWRWWYEGLGGNLVLGITFVLNAIMFIPLGHVAGLWMGRLPKLRGYGLNLIGSLAGIVAFLLFSALWAPPIVWMSVAVLGVIALLLWGIPAADGDESSRAPAYAAAMASIAVMMVSFGVLERAGVQQLFSPYQTIACQLGPDSKYPCVARVTVNQASFQRILDLSHESQSQSDALGRIARYYDLPHRMRPGAERVLVVGAGTGNDVAAALRASARQVTAVEIDPTILFLGERLHPERPYSDARVQQVNDDARTYLRRSRDEFDLIVFGLLDSHTMLGSLTNVRLDSFVYTVESFREAAARLSADGLLAVTFAVMTPQQGKKLYLMLEEAFGGRAPRCFEVGYDAGVMMVAGPAAERLPDVISRVREVTDRFADPRLVAEIATDDWPFFYMPRRTYPLSYAVMIGVLVLLSAWLVGRHLELRTVVRGSAVPFFLLGAGFMLIETKAITQLGLVLGNTWQVLAVVISSIILLAFLGNLWVAWRGPVRREVAFALLAGSLVLGHLATLSHGSGWQVPWAPFVMPVLLTLPLLFSGLIFSSELAGAESTATALAANLFGAMVGGFLEYNSMYWGYASLTWLGLAIYGAAFAWWLVLRLAETRREAAAIDSVQVAARHAGPVAEFAN